MNCILVETIVFGVIMVLVGFIVSYTTDFLSGRPVIWIPKHSMDMASGTFFTASLVFLLFSKKYIHYKVREMEDLNNR
jgi:membrane protein implicated in regulation of membrane protease activity